ncbi:hypothetical protein DXG01_000412, partial [Tephrocybe rancida]
MTHGASYVKYGKVEEERQVMVLSQHLEGKAWKFYLHEISRNPEAWTLERFFKELFNECFLINFQERQHLKLKDFGQGNHKVKDYVSTLEELFTIVGEASP